MRFSFRPLREDDARAMAAWRYEGPYAFYDLTSEDVDEVLAELPSYLAAVDERDQLAGFFASGPGAQVPGGQRAGLYGPDALDVGLGLRPDLVGRGLGPAFIAAGLADLRARIVPSPARFRLSVAAWNERAIRAYTRAGFRAGPRFLSPVRGVDTEFLLMETPVPAEADVTPRRV